jgi:hypothetical protein
MTIVSFVGRSSWSQAMQKLFTKGTDVIPRTPGSVKNVSKSIRLSTNGMSNERNHERVVMKTKPIFRSNQSREEVIAQCKRDFLAKIEELDSNLAIYEDFKEEPFYKSWESFKALLTDALKRLE